MREKTIENFTVSLIIFLATKQCTKHFSLTKISSKQVWRKSYIQGQVSLKRKRHLSLESCATHMTHLAVEELLTLTTLASFFFSNTPTQPHTSLSQPQPSFSKQTQTGNFSSQTHRAQPHASLSSPPPLFSEKLKPTRTCEAKSTAAMCSSRRSHRTTGQPLPPHRSHRTAAAADLVMLHFPTS